MARTGRPRTIFINSSSSYEDVHYVLTRDRGSAKAHQCSCGEAAYEWAYQHNGETLVDPAKGFDFCLDLDCYAPMCRSCHRLLDESVHPGRLGDRGKKGLRVHFARVKTDPEYAEKVLQASRRNVVKAQAAQRADPQRLEKATRAARLGGQALAEKARSDPALQARLNDARRRAIAKANATSRTCDECGKVSTPGGIGVHQHYTGHRGTS